MIKPINLRIVKRICTRYFYSMFESSKYCFNCKGTLFKICDVCKGSGKITFGPMKETLCECYNKTTLSYGKTSCDCINPKL